MRIRLDNLLFPAAAGVALLAALYFVVLAPAPATPESPDAGPAISRGLEFVSKVNITSDTLDAGEQAIPADGKYENLSELALYRKTDFMLDLHFIGDELEDAGAAGKRVEEADSFLGALAQRWQEGSVDYKYFDSGGTGGEYAFDLYCMVALATGDARMAEKIRAGLKERGWSSPAVQKFREIIDESWCIMMLAANQEDSAVLARLADAKRSQLEAYSAGPGEGDGMGEIRRSYAAAHVLMALDFMEEKGYDFGAYAGLKAQLQERIFSDASAHMDSADYLSNSLYFLAKSAYPKQKLAPLASALAGLQKADGGWSSSLSPQMFRGLMSARAVLALNAFGEESG